MNALRGDDHRERERERRSLNAAELSSFRRIAAEITHWRHRRLNSPSAKLSTPVCLPLQWSRRVPSKRASKHHHFMQWRVISSERSLWRIGGSPLLSLLPNIFSLRCLDENIWPPFQHFLSLPPLIVVVVGHPEFLSAVNFVTVVQSGRGR